VDIINFIVIIRIIIIYSTSLQRHLFERWLSTKEVLSGQVTLCTCTGLVNWPSFGFGERAITLNVCEVWASCFRYLHSFLQKSFSTKWLGRLRLTADFSCQTSCDPRASVVGTVSGACLVGACCGMLIDLW